METAFDVGDKVLIEGVIEKIYIESMDNEPIYQVFIEGPGVYESCHISVNEDIVKSSESRQGEWVEGYEGALICSACSNGFFEQPRNRKGKPMFRYCPSCGAYMRKGVV